MYDNNPFRDALKESNIDEGYNQALKRDMVTHADHVIDEIGPDVEHAHHSQPASWTTDIHSMMHDAVADRLHDHFHKHPNYSTNLARHAAKISVQAIYPSKHSKADYRDRLRDEKATERAKDREKARAKSAQERETARTMAKLGKQQAKDLPHDQAGFKTKLGYSRKVRAGVGSYGRAKYAVTEETETEHLAKMNDAGLSVAEGNKDRKFTPGERPKLSVVKEGYKYLHPKARHIPMELHDEMRRRVKEHINALNDQEKARGSTIRHSVRYHYVGPRDKGSWGRRNPNPASTPQKNAHHFVVAHHTKDTSNPRHREYKGDRHEYITAEQMGIKLHKNKPASERPASYAGAEAVMKKKVGLAESKIRFGMEDNPQTIAHMIGAAQKIAKAHGVTVRHFKRNKISGKGIVLTHQFEGDPTHTTRAVAKLKQIIRSVKM